MSRRTGQVQDQVTTDRQTTPAQIGLATIWLLAGQVGSKGIAALVSMILARGLRSEELAAYSYMQMTSVSIASYGVLGLGITATRLLASISTPPARKDQRMLNALLVTGLGCSVVAAAGGLAMPNTWNRSGIAAASWILATSAGLTVLQTVTEGIALGRERFKRTAILAIASGSVTCTAAAVAFVTHTAAYAMLGLILGPLVVVCGHAAHIAPLVRSQGVMPRPTQADLKTLLSFSVPAFLTSLLTGSATWIVGIRILQTESQASSFAAYYIGLQWFSLGLVIPLNIGRASFSKLSALVSQASTRTHVKKLTRLSIGLAALSSAGLTAALLPISNRVATAYGSSAAIDGKMITSFVAISIAAVPSTVLGNAIISANGQVAWLLLTALWYFMLIGLTYVPGMTDTHSVPLVFMSAYALHSLFAFAAARRMSLI